MNRTVPIGTVPEDAGTMTTSSRGRAGKQETIREAAERLFLAHGFAGTTTDAITAAAGVSKETLYRYYPGKTAIFTDVLGNLRLDRAASSLFEDLATVDPGTTEELRQVLTTVATRISVSILQPAYVALVRITIAEARRFPELGTLYREQVPGRALALVEELFRRAQDRGVIGQVDARAAALLFMGFPIARLFLDGLLASEGESRLPAPEEIEAMVDLVMNAVAPNR
jgi:AcrR family transcriptional regulator